MPIAIRHAQPGDHARVAPLVDDWWGGRPMRAMLPRLFFEHFHDTSFVAEDEHGIAGFLCGFLSQTYEDVAYVHFVGVRADLRRQGLARRLYTCFFEAVKARGRRTVRCVTSPANRTSVAFHQGLGFTIVPGDAQVDGFPVHSNYDGAGGYRVLFERTL